MNREKAKEAVKTKLVDYVEAITDHSKSGNYICPLCGSGTGPHHTGAFGIYDGGTRWKCFNCKKGGDILDLIGYKEGIDDYNRKLEIACDRFHIPLDEKNYDYNKTDYSKKEYPKKEETDMQDFFLQANNNIGKTDYLEKRGISLETANYFNLGYVENWKHPNAGKNIKPTPRLIIPTGEDSYLARDIREELTEEEQAYKKMKVGSTKLFNLKALSTDEPIFIVEGELDCVSLYEIGAEAIALGSVAKVNNLLEYLKQNKPNKQLLIALDNDKAGKETTEELTKGLDKLGLNYYVVDIVGTSKDPNEALVKDRELFRTRVQEALNIKTEAEIKEKENYLSNSAYAHLKEFVGGIKDSVNTPYIPTNFKELDNTLDGGLYEGLYIIGAISSLGKTTLITQIADNIAKAGTDVLIFSMEMSRNELIAKSLSRLTIQLAKSKGYNSGLAKTSRGITTGTRYKKYNDSEKELILEAIKEYEKFASNVYIIEGMGEVGVNEIRATIDKHISFTGKTPVVVVDYLQILAPYNIRATDKQNTDKAVMELRRMARDFKTPVIAISSFNRTSYNEAVSMEAFKESGAIEYSCDVLIGLQPKGAGKKDYNYTTEKRKNPREVELIILKNRNGRVGDVVTLLYYPMFNYFEEV